MCGFDLVNIIFICGDSGWIVVDILIILVIVRVVYELVSCELGERLICMVIYSYVYVDYFGGVCGLVEL